MLFRSSGATAIGAGILSLGSSGSISNTRQISIAADATFNVTNRASGFTFTGAGPQQTLAGSSATGTAAIAAGTGAKAVTLASGALLSFQAAGGAGTTAGKISVAGDLNLSSNTITVNVAGLALAAGTNRLLDCTGTLTGSANATPVITGIPLISGYTAAISTTTGAVGHVDLVVTAGQAQPVLASILARNGSMELGGTGTPGQAYVLQTATNLTVPVIWLPILTNTAGTNGVFVFSDPQATNFAVRYYRITTP